MDGSQSTAIHFIIIIKRLMRNWLAVEGDAGRKLKFSDVEVVTLMLTFLSGT
jgi:hypothetical protein